MELRKSTLPTLRQDPVVSLWVVLAVYTGSPSALRPTQADLQLVMRPAYLVALTPPLVWWFELGIVLYTRSVPRELTWEKRQDNSEVKWWVMRALTRTWIHW